MGWEERGTSKGNKHVDYTRLREDIKNVSPVVHATLRNAVPKNGRSLERDENKGKETINPHKLSRLSNIISNNINAVSDLRVITPYIDKAELIWNTILLFPNGKQDQILSYDTQSSKIKNTALHTELLARWADYYTNNYKIEADLKKMIDDMLFNTGSYCLFNLSRPGLDYLINGSEADPAARSGNEAFIVAAKSKLLAEFDEVDTGTGMRRMRNKGVFVRDPHSKSAPRVSGMEALLGNRPEYSGTEFSIFSKEEDPDDLFKITLTDNPSILYLQRFNNEVRNKDINSIMGVESLNDMISAAMETKPKGKKPENPQATTVNLTEEQLDEINQKIFVDRNSRNQTMQYVKTNDTLSVQPYGRGLTWHVPSEAVIPVRHNGGGGKADDYIILLGDDGYFLKNTDDAEFYQGLGKNQNSIASKNKSGSDNQLISSLRRVQEGGVCEFDMSEFAELSKSNIVRRFVQSVISGQGESVSITIDEETNKIFLARMLRGQGVRCLYVPGEAVTYMALKYNRLGIGQSLAHTAKMHIARLAAFDLADTLANIEAAQPHTLMNITPEAEDGDWQNSVAIARAAFFEANPKMHNMLATAQISVPQIIDALRESTLTVKVNAGDNKHITAPEVSLERYTKDNFKAVDDNSRQMVLNNIANYLSLPRAWLDVADDANNFKIEAITEHDMVINQAANWQSQIADFVVDFQRKHARVNGPLLQELVKVILDNKKNWGPDSKETLEGTDEEKVRIILADFFNGVYCSMPTPSNTETTNKLTESLEAVDKLVTAWMELAGNQTVLDQVVKMLGIESDKFTPEEVRTTVKSAFLTEAFRRFNLPMPFDSIINEGKGGGIASLTQSIVDQRINMSEFVAKFFTDISAADKKILKTHGPKLKKLLDEAAAPEEPLPGAEPVAADDNLEGDNLFESPDDLPPEEDVDAPVEEEEVTEEEEGGADQAAKDAKDPNSPGYDPFSGGKE